ncbi:ankyrin repeat-containing protein BDA1-like [Eucalyptus grandis]|uniref:ankyrin repeat-containing protein BDA1-like n=1 Tax=Eucalyptus grandis TaxID=71139 RepID=UPI00192EA4A9|nr:ankyrin repeat-containing protein BDA1-like [Eucalyptus grandis]
MDPRLLKAAQTGDVGLLNDLIRSNPLILEEAALQGAGHTPLHVACVAGKLNFVRELLKLMPKLVEKVNPDGFSPLHIAAAKGDVETVREILKKAGRPQNLCHVKGRERRIPLHYAAASGEVCTLKELLSASPESIEETTAREETALHLAVKNNRFDTLVLLVEHLKQHKKVQAVRFMLCEHGREYEAVEVNASNESGLTPLDVLTLSRKGAVEDREMREILVRAGAEHGRGRSNSPASSGLVSVDQDGIEEDNSCRSDGEPVPDAVQSTTVPKPSRNLAKEKESTDVRNALLVVATVIASATYQAVLQPPSYKIKSDANYKGIFGRSNREAGYISLMSFNTFGFLVSV